MQPNAKLKTSAENADLKHQLNESHDERHKFVRTFDHANSDLNETPVVAFNANQGNRNLNSEGNDSIESALLKQ